MLASLSLLIVCLSSPAAPLPPGPRWVVSATPRTIDQWQAEAHRAGLPWPTLAPASLKQLPTEPFQLAPPGTALTEMELLDRLSRRSQSWARPATRTNPAVLSPTRMPTISSVSGAVRTVVQSVVARQHWDTDRRTLEIELLAHWRPDCCVVRARVEPTLTRLEVAPAQPKHQPSLSTAPVQGTEHRLMIRLNDIPRAATHLSCQGTYRLTAADTRVLVSFRDLTAQQPQLRQPQELPESEVELSPVRRRSNRVEWTVRLKMPPTELRWESFESGLRYSQHQLRLVSPGGQRLAPRDEEWIEDGTQALLSYRFAPEVVPVDLTGWSLEFEAPTPFREIDVPFELDKIPLP